MRQRILAQDIAKGLAVLFVVQLHGLQPDMVMFYIFYSLVSFAMPVFFFLAGFNHRDKGQSSAAKIRRRVGKLLKTYIVWTLGTFTVMGAYFLIRGDGTPEEILWSFAASLLSESGCKMIGWELPVSLFQHVLAPYWFIQYLITASIIFCLTVRYALSSVKKLFSVTVLLLAVTFAFVSFNVYLPWGIHCAPAIAAIMLAGAKLGRDNMLFTCASRKSWIVINSIVCLVTVDLFEIFFPSAGLLGAGLLGEVIGPVEVPAAFVISVFGTYFLVNFGSLLQKIPVISGALIWLGQHSLIIFLIHRPIAYVIRDAMHLPHFISGNPLYVDSIGLKDLIAFLLIFAVMVPVIMLTDRIKARRAS